MRGCGELLERPLLRREIEADRLGHPLVAMGIVVMGKISSGMMTPRSSVDSVVAYEGVSREFLRRTCAGKRRFWFASGGRPKRSFIEP